MVHHLATLVLAAADHHEKSKVPFYLGGGVLAVWAVFLGAVGLRGEAFPGNQAGARAVMGVSVVLVAVAIATALITS